jgi:glucose-1-phosphate adenylyltransferase
MPDKALVSMGNYIFKTDVLQEVLRADHADARSAHDFGTNIIPGMIDAYPVFAYNFLDNVVPGEEQCDVHGYWRDVGTLEAYFEASMDLRNVQPQLNLYNYEWPIRTADLPYPPVKFVFDDERRGMAVQSVIAGGTVISGARVTNSVVFSNVFVHSFSEVDDCILMPGCNIGRNVRLKRAICDKFVTIEDGAVIGDDLAEDAKRFFVSPTGIVVIPKGAVVPRQGAVLQSQELPPPGSIRPRVHVPGSVIITPETVR